MTTTYNVCGVLAGCYKGKGVSERELLTHYEVPGTNDALCGRVREGGLCDMAVEGPPTCEHCVRRLASVAKGLARWGVAVARMAARSSS